MGPASCVPEADAERSRLLAGAAALGIELNPAQAAALQTFGAELARWNRAFNLVSRRDVERLLPRHLLDSLSAAPLLAGARVLDLGTGAGLPGVPLAIVRADMHFTLADRNERKIRFVSQVARRLDLGNVEPLCVDAARLPAAAGFDTVVSRAVAAPAELWALAEPLLGESGRLVLLYRVQGAAAGREAGEAEVPAGARVLDRHSVQIPGLPEPHQVLVLGRASPGRASPGRGRCADFQGSRSVS